MSDTYIFSENLSVAAQLIGLAATLGEPVHAVCHRADAAEQLAAYPVAAVHLLAGDSPRPEDYAPALARLVAEQGAGLLLVGDTISGREVAARVAAQRDAPLVSGAGQVARANGGLETTRIQYGGAVVKTEQLTGFAVISVAGGKYPAAARGATVAPIVTHAADTNSGVRQTALTPIARQGASLDKSKRVVGVVLGFNQQADLTLAHDLADALDAAFGCTRPVADDKKWLPSEQYIGISGANIHADLYVAVGISGQIQHTAGIRDAKVVVAINKDPKAPIFNAADYGIVGDLYEVLPELTAAVKRG